MKNITKFYYSTMKGAPVLSSNWGSLLKAVRIVLTEGFNKNPVTSNTVEGDLRKFTFVEDPGYLLHQVVTLTGCITNPEINGEYRVQKVEGFSVYLATEDVVSTLGGDMFLLTSPMGWSEVFTGTDKAVFRAKDILTNPFFLRIDNSLPVGYDPSWGKFARVTMAEYMLGIDDFGGFAKAPTYLAHPNTNEQGNGVTGASGIYGWAKWYHGVETSTYLKETGVGSSATSSNFRWEIVGDNISFYFFPSITNFVGRATYAFTCIATENTLDVFNCFLSATNGLRAANTNGEHISTGSHSADCQWKSLNPAGKWLLRDYKGTINESISCSLFSLNMGNSVQVSGRSEDTPFPSIIDNSILLHDIYVKTSNGVRGTLPCIQWIHSRWTLPEKSFLQQASGLFIILGVNYHNEGSTSFYAFKLEN